jgi:hypothetical protein
MLRTVFTELMTILNSCKMLKVYLLIFVRVVKSHYREERKSAKAVIRTTDYFNI